MIKKALGLSLNGTWHSAMSENLIKPVENEDFWQANDHQFEIPRGARSAPRNSFGAFGVIPKETSNISTCGAKFLSLWAPKYFHFAMPPQNPFTQDSFTF